MANKIKELIKKIEKCSEVKRSAYCDGKTRKPIFIHRLINEEHWQELKDALVSGDEQ